jgi:D-alanyl-D-alanine dipeptidase
MEFFSFYSAPRKVTPEMGSDVFGALAGLREKPIPDQAKSRAAREGFRARAIDKAGPAFREPLVSAVAHGIAGENYYFITRNPPYWRRIEGSVPDLLMRAGVAMRLKEVNARLATAGLELFLFDAWRPKEVQAYFHDVWMPGELKRRNPSLSGAALTREVERYWAAPTIDENSPAPHATGAALDLTLRWIDGEQLWMGSLFDDVTEIAHRDHFEHTRSDTISFSDEEARANRRLLHWVMSEAGFAGHPDEWWHFSYGDQLWSALTGAPAALYGLAAR